MRSRRTQVTLAITAVMVVVWSSIASAGNGDPLKAGMKTTATTQTVLATNQSKGQGFLVKLSGTTSGAALRGTTKGTGNGVQGSAAGANAAGVYGTNTSTTNGSGAGGYFVGGKNDGVVGLAAAGNSGVRGFNSGTGTGVFGSSVGGAGVQGTAGGANAAGVFGENTSATAGTGSAGLFVGGKNDGVVAQAGDDKYAVRGDNTGTGNGVIGTSLGGDGVQGTTANAGTVGGRFVNTGGGPAAGFEVNPGAAPFTVNSSVLVGGLNADQLDGFQANELVRAAVGGKSTYDSHATFAEQTSVTITAPGPGLALVTGAVSATTLTGGDTSCDPCQVGVRLTDKQTDAVSFEQVGNLGDGTHESATQLSDTWLFVIDAAGSRSFGLETYALGNAHGDVFFDNPTLTILFVPFGPSGQQGAPPATTHRVAPRGA